MSEDRPKIIPEKQDPANLQYRVGEPRRTPRAINLSSPPPAHPQPRRLSVVLTREEVKAVLGNLTGGQWLMASLMYGAGLRLLECLRLRVQDVDLVSNQIVVRVGKDFKDRVTMLPKAAQPVLRDHLANVKKTHEWELAARYGRVQMPYALARKSPNAAAERGWLFLFLQEKR